MEFVVCIGAYYIPLPGRKRNELVITLMIHTYLICKFRGVAHLFLFQRLSSRIRSAYKASPSVETLRTCFRQLECTARARLMHIHNVG